jgi:hypothetical protein
MFDPLPSIVIHTHPKRGNNPVPGKTLSPTGFQKSQTRIPYRKWI